MGIVNEYLKLTEEYKTKYGNKTVVLMQVGSFFEVYALKKSDKFVGSNIEDVAKICDMIIANKKCKVNGYSVYMCGFGTREHIYDKYLTKLIKAGYTVAVYVQDSPSKNTTRSFKGLYSPGTFFSADDSDITVNNISNNIVCFWLSKMKLNSANTNKLCVFGVSCIDIFTGKTSMFEYAKDFLHNPTTYDDLERYCAIYKPNELIIINDGFKETEIKDIISFISIDSALVHIVNKENSENDDDNENNGKTKSLADNIARCEKQTYQQEILKKFYKINDISQFFEIFMENILATQSFCFLLDFVYFHNPNLVYKIKEPLFENYTDHMILANHSLKQLNIIDDNNGSGKVSSIMKFVNCCITSMGTRKLNYDILHPTCNTELLNREYNIIESFIEKDDDIKFIRENLVNINDLEKLLRKFILKKVFPKDLFAFNKNLKKNIKNIILRFKTNDDINDYINKPKISQDCNKIQKGLDKYLNISLCEFNNTLTFDKAEKNIFKRGIYTDLDDIEHNLLEAKDRLVAIQKFFSEQIQKFEKKPSKSEYVKLHETEKMGYSLIATKRRIMLLKKSKLLEDSKDNTKVTIKYLSSYDKNEKEYNFDITNLSFETASGSNQTIVNSEIKKLCNNIQLYSNRLKTELQKTYLNFLSDFYEEFSENMENITYYIKNIDTIQSKTYLSRKYNYCKPEIESHNKSFINVKNLRHPLIENILTDELYVPNDISLGYDEDGILLYGTNAVGKSSLIRSIGICVIMAQSGFYVPASTMKFKPYQSIFTRILGNDNLFKSLSTFAVEMSELRNILTLSNENSLILGDELCSGTENDSAISIFASGLIHMHQKRSSFIFATHFHELVNMTEIQDLDKLKMKHLTVIYNREKDILEYNRKLQDGSGDAMYGLEVCKALHLPQDFLDMAHNFRQKRKPETQSVLSLEGSHFNKKKIKGNCQKCGKKSTEVHHLQHQKSADEKGFIGHFHKNNIANLMNLCEDCHNKIHENDTQYKSVKTTDGYILKEI